MSTSDRLTRLREKYHGNLYLTFIPLNDLTHIFEDQMRWPRLGELTSESGAIESFWSFLNQKRAREMKEAVAFVQLNLHTCEAGFKRMSDLDGGLYNISWTKSEVQGVAELCDIYFHRSTAFEATRTSISSGQVTLKQAWNRIEELKEDPFASRERVAGLLANFKTLVDNRTHELESLKTADRATHDAIETLKSGYDAYLTKQEKEESLAKLLSNETQIMDHIDSMGRLKLNIKELLSKEEVVSSLKESTTPLAELGFFKHLEAVKPEELLRVTNHLKFPLSKRYKSKLKNLDKIAIESPSIDGSIGDVPIRSLK